MGAASRFAITFGSTLWRLVLAGVLLAAGGCASLPSDYPRTETHALRDTDSTWLARSAAAAIAAHPGQDAFAPLADGVGALVMRIYLAERAERSLDLMYYIWRDDLTGRLLAAALLDAADRGVRLRVLLDDLGTGADDAQLLALAAHPNIEIRLFNPIAQRGMRGWGTLVDVGRLNRRMHDKAFIADNQRAVLGGRNIGDEYFGANSDLAFGDLDVMIAGPLVRQVSGVFDEFWNSPVVYPIAVLAGEPGDPAALAALRVRLAEFAAAQRDSPYASNANAQAAAMRAAAAEFVFWGPGHLLADDPLKITRPPEDAEGHLLPKFAPLGIAAQRELLIVSPYFVPGEAGVQWLAAQARHGVRVTVLTNSLASSDVSAVHAGYERYRMPLLEAGVALYELRPQPAEAGSARAKRMLGSSRASLHAKTFMFDRRAVFIGSLNLDPRSIQLNTEIGVVAESAAMVAALADPLESALDRIAWRLERRSDSSGQARLVWIEHDDGREAVLDQEPEVSVWRRMAVWFIGLLPVESQL